MTVRAVRTMYVLTASVSAAATRARARSTCARLRTSCSVASPRSGTAAERLREVEPIFDHVDGDYAHVDVAQQAHDLAADAALSAEARAGGGGAAQALRPMRFRLRCT